MLSAEESVKKLLLEKKGKISNSEIVICFIIDLLSSKESKQSAIDESEGKLIRVHNIKRVSYATIKDELLHKTTKSCFVFFSYTLISDFMYSWSHPH